MVDHRPGRNIALQKAMNENRARLTSVIRGLIRDQVEAEDVLQDVFEEFITAYDLGLAIERLSSWLVTVARNKVLDRFRRKKTQIGYEQILERESPPLMNDEEMQLLLREEIATALEMLPPDQSQAFVMHELEGLSFKEMAAKTKVPIGTLMARKKYAVDFLRNYLKEIYNDDQ